MTAKAPSYLQDLGVFGFDRHEVIILAALVSEDPMLLIGRSGTGKTFLLNSCLKPWVWNIVTTTQASLALMIWLGFPTPTTKIPAFGFWKRPQPCGVLSPC